FMVSFTTIVVSVLVVFVHEVTIVATISKNVIFFIVFIFYFKYREKSIKIKIIYFKCTCINLVTYLPITSNSKFTFVPTLYVLNNVFSNVKGIIATLNVFVPELTTVKLVPSTVIDPLSMVTCFDFSLYSKLK